MVRNENLRSHKERRRDHAGDSSFRPAPRTFRDRPLMQRIEAIPKSQVVPAGEWLESSVANFKSCQKEIYYRAIVMKVCPLGTAQNGRN